MNEKLAKAPEGVQLDRNLAKPLGIAGGIALVVLGLVIFAPGSFLSKLYFVDGAVCAQRAAHSYFFDEQQLPLEARMIGIFGSFSLTWFILWFVGRGRAARLPSRAISLVLSAFVLVMVVDGLNATFWDWNLPTLYPPQNWLRLITGTLSGIGMAALIYPIFNFVLWKNARKEGSIQSWGELAALTCGVGGFIILTTVSGWGLFFWLLAILATFGGLHMLLVMNTLIYVGLRRQESFARDGFDVIIPLSLLFLFGLAEVILLASGRVALLGSPFSF